MSDCSTKAMKPNERRTCGTCAHCEPSEWHCDSKESGYSWMADVDDVDLPCGGYGYERRVDGLDERYERLAQVAGEMLEMIRGYMSENLIGSDPRLKDAICEPYVNYRGKLEGCGVSVDD